MKEEKQKQEYSSDCPDANIRGSEWFSGGCEVKEEKQEKS